MSDQFIGEVRLFGFNFAPVDWAACDGALMPIRQNTTLFAIIGNTYGGDGTNTFALPDLRGRAVMGPVGGILDDPQGEAAVTLLQSEMPTHTHTAYGDNARAASPEAAGRLPARFMVAHNDAFVAMDATPTPTLTTLAPQTMGTAGGSTAHENQQPFLAVNYCIALQGAWPTRP
ncbi:phage tail protein (plasmid) [Ralstonia sp. 25C]|uniref:phage tail protein n=1 Tax=Ralstonia sp. 25C TaxID=3447363 RepID=UPI003F750861